jgi:hypothetical protein
VDTKIKNLKFLAFFFSVFFGFFGLAENSLAAYPFNGRKRFLLAGFIFAFSVFFAGLAFALPAYGATHWVSPTGSASWASCERDTPLNGSSACLLTTANANAIAGDTITITAGTYEGIIQPLHSGSANNYITYVVKPGDMPVIRQVMIINKQYIKVIGFEITHNSTAYMHGVVLNGSSYIEIINNYIHHTYSQGIRNSTGGNSTNHIIVRGNTMTYIGCPSEVAGGCIGATNINLIGSHNLFEYNDISHNLDFFDISGGYNIIRNNYLHDFANSDFPDGSGDAAHVDIWQPYDYPGSPFVRNIFENNWAEDNIEANSHFNQVRDEDSSGEQDAVVRGNVVLRIGSYFQQWGGFDYARVYNNTFSDGGYAYADDQKSWSGIAFTNENAGTDVSSNGYVFNNILYKSARATSNDIVTVVPGSSAFVSNNACEYGYDPGCSVISGISFSDYAHDDLHLKSNSSARSAGKAIATVSSNTGSGTSFAVVDAGFFVGSLGVYDPTGAEIGDLIKVASNPAVKITSINYDTNTITIDSPISWNNGDPITLAYQDSTPDIGAYEYTIDYSYNIAILQPVIVSSGIVRLSASVDNPSNVRYVEFYVNNIPVGADSTPPYNYDWDFGASENTYNITANAYGLFASTNLNDSSSLFFTYGSQGDAVPPSAPAGLSVN